MNGYEFDVEYKMPLGDWTHYRRFGDYKAAAEVAEGLHQMYVGQEVRVVGREVVMVIPAEVSA